MDLVVDLGHEFDGSSRSAVEFIGVKGAGLNGLLNLGLPVPAGFVVTTDAHAAWSDAGGSTGGWTSSLADALERACRGLEASTGRSFGSATAPLLVSVRTSPVGPGAPGRAFLDVGLTAEACVGAAAASSERTVANSRLRLVESFATDIQGAARSDFDAVLANAAALAAVAPTEPLPLDVLGHVNDRFLDLHSATGSPFPEDAMGQLRAAVEALFVAADGPMAVVVQAMVGHRDGAASGSGVASSRNPRTGAPDPHVSFAPDDGTDAPLDDVAPEAHTALVAALASLEAAERDMVEVSFVVDGGDLWLLQAGAGFRTGVAAVQIAHDLVAAEAFDLTKHEALLRISAEHVDQILHPSFGDHDDADRQVVAVGLAASPGAAVGKVMLSADRAAAAAEGGDDVILVAQETSPEDIHGMSVAAGILTTRGGLASHAAVVARGWGTPAVCGAQGIELGDDRFTVGGVTVMEGDTISLDGSTGDVMLGALDTSSAEPPEAFEVMLGWADEIRAEHLVVRANADTGEDAAVARGFGAEGIGLCRTEHMFLGEDRLPLVRQMILATTPAKEKMALTRLRMAQRDDFLSILESMDGLPVTVRLLDPPLHEFLPDVEELAIAEATGELDDAGRELLAAAREWQEQNPMIGTRGVRLGFLKPGLYSMQVTALMEAVGERLAAGGRPIVEVMIPLTVTAAEMERARAWVAEAIDQSGLADQLAGQGGEVTIGTMIETPRAALRAESIAEHSDFFSFGTNDLTQLTLGFSRDDVEAKLMPLYIGQGLLEANPFETIDADGVGELVREGAARGRSARPDLKLGVCGEHGGDPASIALFLDADIDYVSCSPYRVPVARLAAAQAVIRRDD